MWNVQDISALIFYVELILILIDEGSKTAILTIWPALNFEFLGIFDIFKCEMSLKIKNSKSSKLLDGSFWRSEIGQNWFHVKS